MQNDGDIALSKDIALELLKSMEHEDAAFCRGWLPSIFHTEFASLHMDIFSMLKASKKKKKLILAPRGIGKTSIVKGLIIKSIVTRRRHFIVYISNTSALAEMQTEAIKRDLIANPLIRKAFGDVRKRVSDGVHIDGLLDEAGLDESFSKTAWVAFGTTLVLPRGCGQQIRGLNWNNWRPDYIILDDPENRKEIRSETNRRENLTWFVGDVGKCISLVDKDYEFLYVDTLKHEDALLLVSLLISLRFSGSSRII